MAEQKTSGERYWILATRGLAFIISFLPFIPNSLWYIGMNNTKTPIDTSDIIFIVFGFIMLWGSANFGKWANGVGTTIVEKFSKK